MSRDDSAKADVGFPVQVLYGSETGTAEDVAEKVCSLLALADIPCQMNALDDINYSYLFSPTGPHVTAICIISTTGDGKPPVNMREFWKYLLQKKLGPQTLTNVQFAMFGLGDSSYDKYNAAARYLYILLFV